MKGAVVCPSTISKAISKSTNTTGTIHQTLLCQAKPINSRNNRPRYFKNLISRLLACSKVTRSIQHVILPPVFLFLPGRLALLVQDKWPQHQGVHFRPHKTPISVFRRADDRFATDIE